MDLTAWHKKHIESKEWNRLFAEGKLAENPSQHLWAFGVAGWVKRLLGIESRSTLEFIVIPICTNRNLLAAHT
ncbi:unnamed protein product [Symbiodinium necroappetens]|uniref:Uncharacterized protein n=1 Tax=Symbiodinium necroappetens TaxID=1628268 RepID=A0A813BSB8_9DINO|nr:unnamed protein product [Symbiodinium necroappetens]